MRLIRSIYRPLDHHPRVGTVARVGAGVVRVTVPARVRVMRKKVGEMGRWKKKRKEGEGTVDVNARPSRRSFP